MKLDRYQRHSLIDWFSQEDVKGYRFGIIGCGAVGNEVAKNLTLLGVGYIDLYDYDKIEIHNLTRSVLFCEKDVGRNKAEVAALKLRELDPNVNIDYFHGDFWEHLTITNLSKYDCIICCVDNFEARIKLNSICQISRVNLINTGIDSKYSVVEVFPFSCSSTSACYECNLPDSAYERMQKRYSCGWLKRAAYVEKKIPTTIITSSVSGALAVSCALNTLRNHEDNDSKRILIDSFSGRSMLSILTRNIGCPSCEIRDKQMLVAKVKNVLIENLFADYTLPEDIRITTSDQILVSLRCTICNPDVSSESLIFDKASNYDSSITICETCGNESVLVNISDTFIYSDLMSNFTGRHIPGKYLRIETNDENIFLDLED